MPMSALPIVEPVAIPDVFVQDVMYEDIGGCTRATMTVMVKIDDVTCQQVVCRVILEREHIMRFVSRAMAHLGRQIVQPLLGCQRAH